MENKQSEVLGLGLALLKQLSDAHTVDAVGDLLTSPQGALVRSAVQDEIEDRVTVIFAALGAVFAFYGACKTGEDLEKARKLTSVIFEVLDFDV